ncbi:hypothetical protein ACFVT2_19960 [Streptomyces sp. NPDC058000]|uniref:hypothetical protein n=1 Tax=Streptomyces sp. NPDC058000 TaxID=3346299 RepID=UPI0036E93A7D
MPHLNVQIAEELLDGQVETKLIQALTEGVADVFGDWGRSRASVDLLGLPRERRGRGGVPGAAPAPIVTLTMRDGAFTRAGDTPARLVAALTDRTVGVLGEGTRDELSVVLVGIPAGRSGVGGDVA